MAHTNTKIKFKGQSVEKKMETNGQADGWTWTATALPANANQ